MNKGREQSAGAGTHFHGTERLPVEPARGLGGCSQARPPCPPSSCRLAAGNRIHPVPPARALSTSTRSRRGLPRMSWGPSQVPKRRPCLPGRGGPTPLARRPSAQRRSDRGRSRARSPHRAQASSRIPERQAGARPRMWATWGLRALAGEPGRREAVPGTRSSEGADAGCGSRMCQSRPEHLREAHT